MKIEDFMKSSDNVVSLDAVRKSKTSEADATPSKSLDYNKMMNSMSADEFLSSFEKTEDGRVKVPVELLRQAVVNATMQLLMFMFTYPNTPEEEYEPIVRALENAAKWLNSTDDESTEAFVNSLKIAKDGFDELVRKYG